MRVDDVCASRVERQCFVGRLRMFALLIGWFHWLSEHGILFLPQRTSNLKKPLSVSVPAVVIMDISFAAYPRLTSSVGVYYASLRHSTLFALVSPRPGKTNY